MRAEDAASFLTPTWVEERAGLLNVTALRIVLAMLRRAEHHVAPDGRRELVWDGPLTALLPGVPASSLTTGVANLAANGLLRQEAGLAVAGKRGRPAKKHVVPFDLLPNFVEKPAEFVRKYAVNRPGPDSEPLARERTAENTTTRGAASITTPAPGLVRETVVITVLERLGVKRPGPTVARFGVPVIIDALADLAERLATKGAPPVRSAGAYLVDRILELAATPGYAPTMPADLSFLGQWLPDEQPSNVVAFGARR